MIWAIAGIKGFIEAGGIPSTAAQLLGDTRFVKVTAAILGGAVGKSAVDLYTTYDALTDLKACPSRCPVTGKEHSGYTIWVEIVLN